MKGRKKSLHGDHSLFYSTVSTKRCKMRQSAVTRETCATFRPKMDTLSSQLNQMRMNWNVGQPKNIRNFVLKSFHLRRAYFWMATVVASCPCIPMNYLDRLFSNGAIQARSKQTDRHPQGRQSQFAELPTRIRSYGRHPKKPSQLICFSSWF